MTLHVLDAGVSTLVQDRGRPGHGALGVSRSGAFDQRSLAQANALLGNEPGTAGLEVLGGGLRVVAGRDHLVAVTGARGPLTVDGEPVPSGRVVVLRRGQVLRLGPPAAGLRSYLGVAGGIDVAATLGSRSRDVLSGLGPSPVSAGDTLPVGERQDPPRLDEVPGLLASGGSTLGLVMGPRDDWFTSAAVAELLSTGWVVRPDSDRVGVRLDGPSLERSRDGEVPSEPALRGTVQVASDGRPIVLGPDHPVTGGYPVIGVVTDADVDLLAQARPGDVVRFRRRRPA